MEKKTLIIRIQNEKISFNTSDIVVMSNTNIPFPHLKFRTNEEIYWLVELEKYSDIDKCLTVKLIDYNPTNVTTFGNQVPTKEIRKIVFTGKFDWYQLEPQLSSYTKSKFSLLIFNAEKNSKKDLKDQNLQAFSEQ